jgi:hypothetical protein
VGLFAALLLTTTLSLTAGDDANRTVPVTTADTEESP